MPWPFGCPNGRSRIRPQGQGERAAQNTCAESRDRDVLSGRKTSVIGNGGAEVMFANLHSDPASLFEHAAWVRRLAARMVLQAHEADDLAQETWLAALR